jgi:small-conductance mechanosensitive channel
MYFLINSDNTVNFASHEEIPEFMNHSGTWKIELPVDHLDKDDVTYLQDECKYDEASNSIIPSGLRRASLDELKVMLDQQQAIQQALTQQESEKYNKLVSALAKLFPDNAEIKAILSDNVITTDELQQIEDMLNSK